MTRRELEGALTHHFRLISNRPRHLVSTIKLSYVEYKLLMADPGFPKGGANSTSEGINPLFGQMKLKE